MNEIQVEIKEKERKQAQSIPAKRLREKLIPLKSREEKTAKRWFWELLQNASDYNDKVDVCLEINDDEVTFKHNGKPFSITDVLNLIKPDSGKDESEITKDNIGKFGSGLVSTHILSSEITVNGAFKSDDNNELNKFIITLERSDYENKEKLIDSIEKTSKQFRENSTFIETNDYKGFMTSFSYNTNKKLPKLSNTFNAVEQGVKHIYEILPYTLCFLPKVNSVEIIDKRKTALVSNYTINRTTDTDKKVSFKVKSKSKEFNIEFVKIKHKTVETVYQIDDNNNVSPYPNGISKIFCGLPMIGTEEIGLPLLINSFDFEPKVERDGVEITPNDKENISIFKEILELYEILLNDISDKKLDNAFHITKLSNKYIGEEGSKNIFKRDFVPKFKKLILDSKIVKNNIGEFICFSKVLLPYNNGKPFSELYKYASQIKGKQLTTQTAFEGWVNATDFTLFPNQKYSLEKFVSEISILKKTTAFVLSSNTPIKEWLKQIVSLVNEIDDSLFVKYTILPNQKGELCTNSLSLDKNLPSILKEIYNYFSDENIEIKLLDTDFNEFDSIITNTIEIKDICNKINDFLKENYKNYNASTASFVTPLNKLYNWLNKSELNNKELEELFPWFFPKRATLFMDSFGDKEREYAFTIVQSGKIKALALLAESNISEEELEYLSENPDALSKLFALLQNEVDDKKNANIETGEIGEKLVYQDLLNKFQKASGFEVIWSSRNGEPRFDFEVKLKGETYLYVDAKTTMRGLSNGDSIPFYMRNSQWEFLPKIENKIKYLIARVFKNGEVIKYLQLDIYKEK